MNGRRFLVGASSGVALSVLAAAPAWADGTQSGSTITNTVTVNYSVDGTAQPALTASNSFTVDRKVNLTVNEVGTATTTVSPGRTSAVTAFLVTNTSNAVLDFVLSAAQQDGGAAAHGGTDNFDATNVRIYLDAAGAGAGAYGAEDSQVGFIDELAADTGRTVFVVVDVPVGRVTNDVAAVVLTATAREGGAASATTPGAALVQTTTANTVGVDTVFADGAGSTDGSRDASFSAKDDYTIAAAALSILKLNRIVSDPLNGTTDPKLIPGSIVEYCVSVANASGGAAATGVTISDPLPVATTYQPTFGILVNGTVTGGVCNADGTSGGGFASGTVSATIPSIAAGDTRTVMFRVAVN